MPEEFGIKDHGLLRTVIEMIATNPGMILNYDAISKDLGKHKKTILDYFFYLEYALLIRTVANYRKGFLVSSRKKRKAYVTTTAISFAFVQDFYSPSFLEKIAENFAVIETDAGNYYRNGYEVDIILKLDKRLLPVEVKYGTPRVDSLMRFLEEFDVDRALVLTKDVFEEKIVQAKKISLVPLWAFAIDKENYLKWPKLQTLNNP